MHTIQPDTITRSGPGTGKWIIYHNNITNEKKITKKTWSLTFREKYRLKILENRGK